MVKNTKGGSQHKKFARKNNMTEAEGSNVKTRYADPKEPCEMYALVTKLFGQGMCEVKCNDGKSRLCVIRNKFRGRNKLNNVVTIDSKVLVGLRDWEVVKEGKLQKCDLLEVYSMQDVINLKNNDKSINWTYLTSIDEKVNNKSSTGLNQAFEFGDVETNEEEEEFIYDFDDVRANENIVNVPSKKIYGKAQTMVKMNTQESDEDEEEENTRKFKKPQQKQRQMKKQSVLEDDMELCIDDI